MSPLRFVSHIVIKRSRCMIVDMLTPFACAQAPITQSAGHQTVAATADGFDVAAGDQQEDPFLSALETACFLTEVTLKQPEGSHSAAKMEAVQANACLIKA
jgi:hypothetical protein